MNATGYGQSTPPLSSPMDNEKIGGSPSKQSLVNILSEKRSRLLSELRDIEQALEALEHTPDFEPTFQRVLKILQRSY